MAMYSLGSQLWSYSLLDKDGDNKDIADTISERQNISEDSWLCSLQKITTLTKMEHFYWQVIEMCKVARQEDASPLSVNTILPAPNRREHFNLLVSEMIY